MTRRELGPQNLPLSSGQLDHVSLSGLVAWSKALHLPHDRDRLRELQVPVSRRLEDVAGWADIEPDDTSAPLVEGQEPRGP